MSIVLRRSRRSVIVKLNYCATASRFSTGVGHIAKRSEFEVFQFHRASLVSTNDCAYFVMATTIQCNVVVKTRRWPLDRVQTHAGHSIA